MASERCGLQGDREVTASVKLFHEPRLIIATKTCRYSFLQPVRTLKKHVRKSGERTAAFCFGMLFVCGILQEGSRRAACHFSESHGSTTSGWARYRCCRGPNLNRDTVRRMLRSRPTATSRCGTAATASPGLLVERLGTSCSSLLIWSSQVTVPRSQVRELSHSH